jgi:hypothetical protein
MTVISKLFMRTLFENSKEKSIIVDLHEINFISN